MMGGRYSLTATTVVFDRPHLPSTKALGTGVSELFMLTDEK